MGRTPDRSHDPAADAGGDLAAAAARARSVPPGEPPRVSRLAVTAVVIAASAPFCFIVLPTWCTLFALPALATVLGVIAAARVRESGGRLMGRKRALCAVVLGLLWLSFAAFMFTSDL